MNSKFDFSLKVLMTHFCIFYCINYFQKQLVPLQVIRPDIYLYFCQLNQKVAGYCWGILLNSYSDAQNGVNQFSIWWIHYTGGPHLRDHPLKTSAFLGGRGQKLAKGKIPQVNQCTINRNNLTTHFGLIYEILHQFHLK